MVMACLEAVVLICLSLQFYHYVLYPLLLGIIWWLRRGRPAPAGNGPYRVSLIISAFNEERVIADKLRNCAQLVPAPVEVILVCDGSDDHTAEIARGLDLPGLTLHVMHRPERQGKSAAMNRAADCAIGDILLFSDANAFYLPETIGAITREFRDPSVAVVSGAKKILEEPAKASSVGQADGLYWRYEAFIRKCESDLGTTVASVGEILSIRQEYWRPIPPGTVNDDAWMTLVSLAQGLNVRFAPDAISLEEASPDANFEATRRRRINSGRLKLLGTREVWPLRRPRVLLALLSHKVLRVLLPIPMIAGFVANLAVVMWPKASVLMDVTLLVQLAALGLGVAGHFFSISGRKARLPSLAYHVLRGNVSALLAMYDVMRGQSHTIWQKPPR
ncbi:hypothetical protein C1J03_15420 [Sulfitobacter sp. SK012]|uniref:glycosyltransferase n=1 Tax=Sulfitobacter sp. SK012 TaxID=1389005 RepID=UPI000E0C54CD|nr:glycosyltransferase [Sulfitobacter sp. SK012]AXI47276.1 hypothetical protein C1J03_15420 [Sulfitobacter sp. SK012]